MRVAMQGLVVAMVGTMALLPTHARAWGLGSQLDFAGCHEQITAQALRNVRTQLTTAPYQTTTRNEAALFADVQFGPPADLLHDLGAMTLLLGVRDNDLKGVNPTDSLSLVAVHGNPNNQDEHCLRSTGDDGELGEQSALAACRKYIVDTATAALAGLDGAGRVDMTITLKLDVWVSIRGYVSPALPLFFVKIGRAMHALEDGFTHTNRSADGLRVTTVRNWVDPIERHYDEQRDGLEHNSAMDDCANPDPLIQRNLGLATDAATELLHAALDPALTAAQKTVEFERVTQKYLSYEAGCRYDNEWCDPAEEHVVALGCELGASRGGPPWLLVILLGALALVRRRRRVVIAVACLGLFAASVARADGVPADPDAGIPAAAKPVTPENSPDTPLILAPVSKDDVASTQKGEEPGRDTRTPTIREVQSIRRDKRLGHIWGLDARLGASSDRPALAFSLGVRYRISEKWVTGFDVGWNPWITTAPRAFKAGVITMSGTIIRRFPMSFDRTNIRTSFHFGVATLLFDVYGAPSTSTGPYIALSPLGLDFDLGHSWRIVWDPAELAIPIPVLGALPLYYEQFRFMLGLQWGA